MLLNTIAEKHPNSFVLLLPKARDEQNRVRDWQVLNTSRHYDEILKVAKYYRAEGMNDAVICSTCDELVVPPNESAKFVRVYYSMLTIAKVVLDRARERWKQKGFDADITDILEDYRAETNKKIKREKVNVLSTFLISLYDYDHDSLQLDITKLIVLSPSSEFPAKDKRKLLQILWSTIQMLYADAWSEVLNEVNRLGEWARANPEEFPVK